MEEVVHVWTGAALGVTVLMGGLIAYAGDLIGRKLGKRRASVFGLRPRHTAVLITSVTGVLISLLTTAALFLAVNPVRDVMLRGEAAIRAGARLRRENSMLTRENVRVREDVAHARQSREIAARQRSQAVSERKRAEQELTGVRVALAKATNAVRRARAARAAAERAVRVAHAQVRMERDAARQLATSNESLRTVNEDLKTRSQELTKSNEALRQVNSSLSASNSAYSLENEAVSKQNESLVRERDRLTGTVTDLRAEQVRLAEQTSRLQSQYQELMDSYKTAYGAHRSLWTMFDDLRTKRIVIHGGEDLARIVVPASTAPDGVRSAIDRLLGEAHVAALAKGAAPGERARAVEIVDKRFATPTPAGVSTTRVTEQDRIDAIVNRLSRAPEPTCLLALAVSNSVIGEPAAIDLQPLPNPLVYRRGQLVAARKLDASGNPGDVFSELVLMLKGLGQSALGRGLIPRVDPATGEPQVGALSAADVANLAARIRAYKGRVEVSAYASADVNAGDALGLEFKIRPAI